MSWFYIDMGWVVRGTLGGFDPLLGVSDGLGLTISRGFAAGAASGTFRSMGLTSGGLPEQVSKYGTTNQAGVPFECLKKP